MVFVADNGAHLVKELEKLDIPARTIGLGISLICLIYHFHTVIAGWLMI